MADMGAAQGWEGYLWAGADGEAILPTELLTDVVPTPAQIAGKELPPEGWHIVPVHAADQRLAGFVGACAPGDDMALVHLAPQAVLLGQILAREGELDSMTAELMGTYDLLVAMYNISQATRSNLKRNDNLLLLIGWWAVLFAAANTHVMGMTPLFSNLVLRISLYLPAGTLIGYLASELTSLAVHVAHGRRHLLPIMRWGTIIACVAISVAGVRYTTGLIRAENAFVRSADLDAVQWIQQNVSEEALFHIRTNFWTPLVAHGLDAGYWLPYLAQREVTVPLEPYASDGSPEYMAFVNRRARDLVEADTPEQLWQRMTNYDVTHVYLGNRPANRRADFFLGDPAHFRLLHSQNGVWIFEAVH